MNKNYFETIIGFLVIFVAVYFVFFALSGSSNKEETGYTLNVDFDRVDGLSVGSDVKISGLKIGSVIDADIDPKTYLAKIKLNVIDEVRIPADSTAEIISAGLLGDKYIALVPGGDEKSLEDGDKISFSQSSISIESLIGKFMFSGDDNKKENKSDKKDEELSSDDIFK